MRFFRSPQCHLHELSNPPVGLRSSCAHKQFPASSVMNFASQHKMTFFIGKRPISKCRHYKSEWSIRMVRGGVAECRNWILDLRSIGTGLLATECR